LLFVITHLGRFICQTYTKNVHKQDRKSSQKRTALKRELLEGKESPS